MGRECCGKGSGGGIAGAGEVFTMTMHNDEIGDYEIFNQVIECEPTAGSAGNRS
jgi:hypothetical protein